MISTLLFLGTGVLWADEDKHEDDWLDRAKEIFIEADRVGPPSGDPLAIPVFQKSEKLGYLFATNDVFPIPAYSGQPINILIGLDLRGRLLETRILEHHEPILLAGVSEQQLRDFIAQYRNVSIFDRVRVGGESRPGNVAIDTISGASITVMVANATIIESARKVADSRGITAAGKPIEQKPKAAKPAKAEPRKISKSIETKKPKLLLLENEDNQREPMWVIIWKEKKFQIVVLVISLVFLTTILLFQDWLVRRSRVYEWVRHSFLIYTVFFIGWYSLAQLSIVNVLTFVNAIIHEFHWETFALDPLMFILWAFVAFTLILWGRGIYCGWLCPFGALQELINVVARHFKVKQWEFPDMVHERLWALKYVILIMLFGISLQSVSQAEYIAEIEPFKTVFLLRFNREAPFVVYAVVLMAISIVNRKFFCKYLCPLGAALVIPAQNRLFNWVRRRNECGKPCQVCANECEVRAISPTGEINKNECHYCLDCQVTYFNNRKCPPLAKLRKTRERLEAKIS
ncbi:MAG: 4Fe-4S binding protein [Gammaproteobacteria bacterium]|nr:4Fe-4S binding protein [Gammaproteobacteria bacterium]